MDGPSIRIFTVRAGDLDPAFVRECAGRLTPEARAEFARMADPRAADGRAVLRASAHRLRAAGEAVSVAHSGGFGVLASSAGPGSLGVDCEPWAGEIPEAGVVREVTSPEEFVRWETLPEPERRRAFVRLWTLKEAAFKAGAGPMAGVHVSPDFFKTEVPGFTSEFVDADAAFAVAVVGIGGLPRRVVRLISCDGSF